MRSGNLLADFETEDDALAAVHAQIEAYGEEAVMAWAVGTTETDDPPLEGAELIRRARLVPVAPRS